ncbi:MAG: hypothetical protein JST86_10110 [Bacteroidetes bacterium]|nr:hypothetical protein [Bacteroidota bacterium]
MKKLFYFLLLVLPALSYAQVGIGTTTPVSSAALDVTSTTKGFLPPRMTQAQMNAISNPVDGLIIYCTDCSPKGLYVYDGSSTPAWSGIKTIGNSSNSSNGSASVSTWDCGGAQTGLLIVGQAASGVTKVVTATVTTAGTYNISTTANGVTFSGSGTFAGTGNQQITLTASGTPTSAGVNIYALNTTPFCAFSTTTYSGSTINYITASRTSTNQTGIGVNSDIILNNKVNGTIPYNTGTGVYTLSANKTYRLTFEGYFINYSLSNVGDIEVEWVDAGTNTPLVGSQIGRGVFTTNTSTISQSDRPVADIIYTTSASQQVKLRVTAANGTADLYATGASALIQELGFQYNAGTLNTVDYVMASRSSSNQTGLANGSTVVMNTVSSGTIPVNTTTGAVTLTGGKTYKLIYSPWYMNYSASGWVSAMFTDASGTALSQSSYSQVDNLNSPDDHGNSGRLEMIYTPATTQDVKIKIVDANGQTFELGTGSTLIVQQLGVDTSAATAGNISLDNGTATIINSPNNTDLALDQKLSGTGIANDGNTKISLKAGKTYRLVYNADFKLYNAGGGSYMQVQWWDATNNVPLESSVTASNVWIGNSFQGGRQPVAELFYTPSADIDVKIRVISTNCSSIQYVPASWAMVTELGISELQ